MKKGYKIGLIAGVSLLTLVLGIGVSGYFFIRSASGSRFILSTAKKQLAKSGITMNFSEGSLDPFSRVSFRDLKLSQNSNDPKNGTKMEVIIPFLEIQYRLSPFSRRVEVEKFEVHNPSVFYHAQVKEASANSAKSTATPTTEDSPQAQLKKLGDLLSNPPVKFVLRQFDLSGLVLDIDYQDPTTHLQANIPKLQLRSSFSLTPRQLSSTGEFSLSNSSHLSFGAEQNGAKMEFSASPFAELSWDLGLSGAAGPNKTNWSYDLKSSRAQAGLKSLVFQLASQEPLASNRVEIPEVRFKSQCNIHAESTPALEIDPQSLTALVLDAGLSFDEGKLIQTKSGKQNRISLGNQSGQVTIGLSPAPDSKIAAKIDFIGKQIFSKEFLNRPSRFEMHGQSQLSRDLKHLAMEGGASLEDLKLFTCQSHGDVESGANGPSGMSLQGHCEIAPQPQNCVKAAAILKPAAPLKSLGAVFADLEMKGSLKGNFSHLGQLTRPGLSHSSVEGDLRMNFRHEPVKLSVKPRSLASFDPVQMETHFTHDGEKLGFKTVIDGALVTIGKNRLRNFHLEADGELKEKGMSSKWVANFPDIKLAQTIKSISAGMSTTAEWNRTSDQVLLKGIVKVQNEEALKFEGTGSYGAGKFALKSTGEAIAGSYLEAFFEEGQLDKVGKWVAKTEITLESEFPKDAAESFMKGGTLTTTGTTTFTQTATHPTATRVSFASPLQLTHKIEIERGRTAMKMDMAIPTVSIPGKATVKGTQVSGQFHSPNLASLSEIDLALDLKQGEIRLSPELAKKAPPLSGLNAQMQVSLRDQDRFTVEKLNAEFNHSLLKFTAEGRGRVKQKEFLMHGNMQMVVPKDFPRVAENKISGEVDFPWSLAVRRGREINFEGGLELHDLGWERGDQKVAGISGRVPVAERLVFDGKQIRFAYLVTQNPFERVDYERLRPLISSSSQVRVAQMAYADKNYGPFVGFFSMQQNMLYAHQFDLPLGTRGYVSGEMYLNAYPDNLQFGILSRLTAVDLMEILPKKFLVNLPQGEQNVSGRSGLVVNLNKGTVDGRVDVTEIGRGQLITLINVLDPKYEDDKMNMTRNALGLGYPSFVEMSFQKGYLDMGVDMVVLGVKQRIDVRGIPISTFVASATADLLNKTRQGPLGTDSLPKSKIREKRALTGNPAE